MKKLAKLLAVVLAFAMVASVMVMPVSADPAGPVNLITNGDFESCELGSTNRVTEPETTITNTSPAAGISWMGGTTAAYWEVVEEDGDKALKVSYTTAGLTPAADGKYNAVQLISATVVKPSGYHYVAVDAKAVAGAEITSGSVYRSYDATSVKLWSNDSKMTTTGWTTYKGVVNCDVANQNLGLRFQICSNNVKKPWDFYVDNFRAYKLELAEDKATNVAPGGTLTLTGPEELALKATDITISDGTKSVNPSAVAYADGKWAISYAGLSALTNYTLTINTTNGSAITSKPTYTFTTREKTFTETLADSRIDKPGDNIQYSNTDSMTYKTIAVVPLTDGIYEIPAGAEVDTNAGVAFGKINVYYEENKVYYVTCKIKDATPDNDGVEGDKAPVAFTYSCGHECTVPKYILNEGFGVNVTSDDWTTLGYVFDAGSIECTNSGHKGADGNIDPRMHIGFRVHDAGNDGILVKDFIVAEIPAFTVSAAMDATTDVADTTEITYTFSAAPVAAPAAANVAIAGGTGVAEIVKVSDTVYKAVITGLEKGANYTVTLTGMKDVYGQTATAEASFKTVVLPIQTSKEILAYSGFDGTFTNSTGAAEGATVVEGVTLDDGNRVMKVTAAQGTWTDFRINNLCDGKDLKYGKYIVTYYVKLAEGSANTEVALNPSPSAILSNKRYPANAEVMPHDTFTADKWTKVVSVFDICEYTVDTAGKIDAVKAEALKKGEEGSNEYKAEYDRLMNPATWRNGPFHLCFGMNTTGATVYIDNVEMRQLMPLDISTTELATAVPSADKLTVKVATSAEKTIYVVAAKYEGNKMVDIKFAKTTKAADSLDLLGVDNTYKLMIWDASLNPLSGAVAVSEY